MQLNVLSGDCTTCILIVLTKCGGSQHLSCSNSTQIGWFLWFMADPDAAMQRMQQT